MRKEHVIELQELVPTPLALASASKSNSWSKESSSQITPISSKILEGVRTELAELQRKEDNSESVFLSSAELSELVLAEADKLGVELSSYEKDTLVEILEKEQQPFGVLQELIDDKQVSDIIVTDYSHISIKQGGKVIATGVAFPDQASYEAFVEKILQRAGASYSTKQPIADGMIGKSVRVHAVHRCICASGPYLTLRINRYASVTCEDLVKVGLAPAEIFQYLKACLISGQTLLIVGEVGTGKTTLARAVAGSISPEESILVIEDTPEIRLEHPQVRYMVTRSANTDDAGKISAAECIRAGMRMAMNRIIFGEIRDAEAAEAFIDVCSSGHPGLSTIHAKSGAEALTRLELFLGRAQRGVARQIIYEQIATAVQVIVFLNICKVTGKRRIIEVREVSGAADGTLRQRLLFNYEPQDGLAVWKVKNKSSCFREQIESCSEPCFLADFPNELWLDDATMFREAV
ncbi:MAG: CpaF family protein [Candidatus Dadabacteria bacterium]|nr:MAG: CpaF family protein [Candidatus Dadabacteria bacterium]